ncbi:hypothetical protein ACWV27_26080 (plasmid) [Massilia varians]|jgi:hypothetical protein|uniref:hypothetical protein n=1 Tax=Massilia TaxID=149698 RepID=UPI00048661CC|nr:hypothetical protein [Massilia alkalitolerans]
MSVPLTADPNVLARLAVKSAPRLAAMLMASHHSGKPLTATPHCSGAAPAASLILSPTNPLARWASLAVDAVDAARARHKATLRAGIVAPAAAPARPTVRTPVSPIANLYKRLLGEGTATSRPRGIDEQVEAARPAEAGRTAPALEQADNAHTSRTGELVALAAVVIGVGYGDRVDRAATGGEFDVTVFQNLMRAADVIAPGQSIASLDPVRLRAVLTAGLQSSNGAFLRNMPEGGRAVQSMAAASKLVPDGAKAASEFIVGGKFSESAFLQKTAGVLVPAAQLASATPVGAKLMLLHAAAEKAKDLVDELKRDDGPRNALRSQIFRSISDRLDELDTHQPPADKPTAPGVR